MTIDCKAFELLLADAIGGELRDADRRAFDEHRANCPTCDAEYRSMAETVSTLHDRLGAPAESADRLSAGASKRTSSGSRWNLLRYAAAAAIAFGAGYGLRGTGGANAPRSNGPDVAESMLTIQARMAMAHQRAPGASAFAKSILAVVGSPAAESQ